MGRSAAFTAVWLGALALTVPWAPGAAAEEPSHWLKPTEGLTPYGVADIRHGVSGDLAVAILESNGYEVTARRAGAAAGSARFRSLLLAAPTLRSSRSTEAGTRS